MNARKIAITGVLSSGKSTVCRLFMELGAYVVSADAITHRLLATDPHIQQQVIALFGRDVLSGRSIDRSKIAKKAFTNPLLLQALENLLHPIILNEIEKNYQRHCHDTALFIAEIPLLFEIGAEKNFQATIAIVAPQNICETRFCTDKNHTYQEYELRMKRQLTGMEKAAKATYVIHNNGTLDQLKDFVIKIYAQLLAEMPPFTFFNPKTGV